MSSAAAHEHDPVEDRVDWLTATPAQIRTVLLSEQVDHFEAEWRSALGKAAETYTLRPVERMLGKWRAFAKLAVDDPDAVRRLYEIDAKLAAAAQRGDLDRPGETLEEKLHRLDIPLRGPLRPLPSILEQYAAPARAAVAGAPGLVEAFDAVWETGLGDAKAAADDAAASEGPGAPEVLEAVSYVTSVWRAWAHAVATDPRRAPERLRQAVDIRAAVDAREPRQVIFDRFDLELPEETPEQLRARLTGQPA